MTHQLPREQMDRLRAIILDEPGYMPPTFDPARFVAASRARRAEPHRPIIVRQVAPSGEACIHCGIPMWRGCDHFEPYVRPTTPAYRGNYDPHQHGYLRNGK